MSDNFDSQRLDIPVFVQDFQNTAIEQGYHVSTGTRLFGDLIFRNWFYDAAVQRQSGQPLRAVDRSRLGNLPEEVLDVHYFGDDTSDPTAMSLNGLRTIIKLGLVDDMISARKQRSTARLSILGGVIAAKMTEQSEHIFDEVE